MTRLLLDHHGADVNIQRDDLQSPLHLASANGHLKIVELLVQRGESVDLFNKKQKTPLYQVGRVTIVRVLIDHGANLHSIDSNGWTPLRVASHNGHLGVVKPLLKKPLLKWGADVNVLNKANETADKLASENGQAEVARLVAEYKADADIRNKIRSATLDTAQYGADEDRRDEGKASLHVAAEEGDIDVVKSLLEQGVDINDLNSDKMTPLDRAAAKGKVDVVRLCRYILTLGDTHSFLGYAIIVIVIPIVCVIELLRGHISHTLPPG